MSLATKYETLRSLSKEELIRIYDGHTSNTYCGLDFYREEIARRDAEEQTAMVVTMTRQMRSLTIVITILTVINVIAACLAVLL